MSVASMANASSISARIWLVQGSAPKMPDRERGFARVDALACEFVQDREHVARSHHDDVRLEIGDELHLPFGHAAGDRDHRAAEPLGAVMRAEPAGEQAIAVGDMNLHAGPSAGGADRARHQVRPVVDVGLGVSDHGRLAGGARRSVDADDPVLRHREHAERIIRPQVGLGRKREFRDVFEGGRLKSDGFTPAKSNFFL